MGGSGSTRRVVVEQMDGTGVVRISESVVKRLKGEVGIEDPRPAATDTSPVRQVPSPIPSPPPEFARPLPYPTRDKGEASAVQEIEHFYKQKLQDLEEKNALLSKITNEQFAKAVQEVEKKFLKQTGSPICQDLQSKVYDCYLENQTQTIKCSHEVRAFSSCVEKAKQNALSRKG